jgi:hypothetical protein
MRYLKCSKASFSYNFHHVFAFGNRNSQDILAISTHMRVDALFSMQCDVSHFISATYSLRRASKSLNFWPIAVGNHHVLPRTDGSPIWLRDSSHRDKCYRLVLMFLVIDWPLLGSDCTYLRPRTKCISSTPGKFFWNQSPSWPALVKCPNCREKVYLSEIMLCNLAIASSFQVWYWSELMKCDPVECLSHAIGRREKYESMFSTRLNP